MQKILFVTEPLPYPVRAGGVLRVASLIKVLAKHPDFEVHVLGFQPETFYPNQLEEAQAAMPNVTLHPYTIKREQVGLLRSINLLKSGNPAQLSAKVKQVLADLHHQHQFDIIQFERTNVGFYVDAVPLEGKRPLLVLDSHDVMTVWWQRVLASETSLKLRAKAFSRLMGFRYWEPRLHRRFDRVLAVSAHDMLQLKRLNPHTNIKLIPNGVDCTRYRPLSPATNAQPAYILLVGSFSYKPNIQAAHYMAEGIMPHIIRLLPDYHPKLLLVGGSPTSDILDLPKQFSWVELRSDVPEIEPCYQQSRLVVAPLKSGTGTRLKILEAMALGRAIVTTTIGCEGIPLIDGDNALIADEPLRFAEKVALLIKQPDFAQTLSAKARLIAEQQFDWDNIGQRLIASF